MGAPINLTGQRFGRLTVISYAGTAKTGGREWHALAIAERRELLPPTSCEGAHSELRVSEGGSLREVVTVHGQNTRDYKSPEYNSCAA